MLELFMGCLQKTSTVRGARVFVKCGYFSDNVFFFSDADVRTLWCKTHWIFWIYGVFAQTRGRGGRVEPVRTFCGQGGGGQFLAILCGRLLWTAPYQEILSSCSKLFADKIAWSTNTTASTVVQYRYCM